MTTRPQTRTLPLIVLTALVALLALATVLVPGPQTLTARQSTPSTEVTALKYVPNPRVRFAPLAGRRTPAPIANLEAPLAGRRTPAPIANEEAPFNLQRLPGSALYVLGTGAIALIGAVRERMKRR